MAIASLSDTERTVLIEVFSLQQGNACGPCLSNLSSSLTPVDKAMSERAIGLALGMLEARKLIEKKTLSGEPSDVWRFTTTPTGNEFISTEYSSGRLSYKHFENPDYDLTEINGYKESKSLAAEDVWEPLPLDRQDTDLALAIEKIDELIQAVKQDNGYAANEPDERNFIVSALQAGVQALKDQPVILRIQFTALVWEPIKQLAKRFGPSAIGVLADAAKEGLKEAFKHVAKKILDDW